MRHFLTVFFTTLRWRISFFSQFRRLQKCEMLNSCRSKTRLSVEDIRFLKHRNSSKVFIPFFQRISSKWRTFFRTFSILMTQTVMQVHECQWGMECGGVRLLCKIFRFHPVQHNNFSPIRIVGQQVGRTKIAWSIAFFVFHVSCKGAPSCWDSRSLRLTRTRTSAPILRPLAFVQKRMQESNHKITDAAS